MGLTCWEWTYRLWVTISVKSLPLSTPALSSKCPNKKLYQKINNCSCWYFSEASDWCKPVICPKGIAQVSSISRHCPSKLYIQLGIWTIMKCKCNVENGNSELVPPTSWDRKSKVKEKPVELTCDWKLWKGIKLVISLFLVRQKKNDNNKNEVSIA